MHQVRNLGLRRDLEMHWVNAYSVYISFYYYTYILYSLNTTGISRHFALSFSITCSYLK